MYYCPMHPEIRQETPGRCPKCGMVLVKEGTIPAPARRLSVEDRGLGYLSWRNYVPLIVIFLLLIASSFAVSLNDHRIGAFSLGSAVSYLF